MVNVHKFHSLDIIVINVSYPYLLSSYFFLIYTYVNLFKIEIHNKLWPTQERMSLYDYKLYFSDKIGGTVEPARFSWKMQILC